MAAQNRRGAVRGEGIMKSGQCIPFASPILIEEYEKGYPFRNGWRIIAVATSQYNADIIIAGLSAKYRETPFRKEISEVKAL